MLRRRRDGRQSRRALAWRARGFVEFDSRPVSCSENANKKATQKKNKTLNWIKIARAKEAKDERVGV